MTELRRIVLRVIAVAAGAATLGGCFAARPTYRYFQPSPDQVGPYTNSFGEAVVPRHGLIVVQGDSLAYGLARGRSAHAINGADEGQASMTISQSLRRVLGAQVTVENRGFPRDTVAASAARWAGRPPGNLLILSYGDGDRLAHTAPQAYVEALRAMIKAAHAGGAAVFVVLPPASSDALTASGQGTYRALAQLVGQQEGAEIFDAGAAMARIKAPPSKSAGQRGPVYAAVAGDLTPYIKVVDAPS